MKRIFLIDDDFDDREIFREAIASMAFQSDLVQAEDGEQALEMLESKTFKVPDIIFLDLNMPKMGGLDFLKAIRLMPEYKEIPVIIYSTSSRQKDRDDSALAGANGFITKHYSFDELYEELRSVFE